MGELIKETHRFLQTEVDAGHIPGAVLSVSFEGKTILEQAVGWRSLRPEKKPIELDTIFDLASLTKVVATLPSLLKLVEKGDIHLEDSVSEFIPAFSHPYKRDIKVWHLLTHTSGLQADLDLNYEQISQRELEQVLEASQPIHIPGEKVIYSDLGMIFLKRIIETVTGECFAPFVQREIFEPLEMNQTTFNPPREGLFASTEFCKKLGVYKEGIVHDEKAEVLGGISGHAGLFSTLRDLENFAAMIENDGAFQNRRILSSRAVQLSKQNFTPNHPEYRGLGWLLKGRRGSSCGDLFSYESYGHTGFTGTSIWFDPQIKLHVILLTNRVHLGRHPHILRLRPRLHNLIRSYF